MNADNAAPPGRGPALPATARLPINRCNLPPVILGGLAFQETPQPLEIDGIRALRADLFDMLDALDDAGERAQRFMDYMTVHFLLEQPEEAGFDGRGDRDRTRADYLKTLRGWGFDADGREGAILKSWIESRFGLLPRHHLGPLGDFSGDNYGIYQAQRSQGLYGTNGLEAQLDVLYTYCQYELKRAAPEKTHRTLYRGVNRLEEYEVLDQPDKRTAVLLLNNLNSFTATRDRATEFGDTILKVEVPIPKIFCFNDLLPGRLRGEDELIVIGGVYRVGSFLLLIAQCE